MTLFCEKVRAHLASADTATDEEREQAAQAKFEDLLLARAHGSDLERRLHWLGLCNGQCAKDPTNGFAAHLV